MHVHPPASRLKFLDNGSLLTIEIPSKRNWLLILFLGFWLCGWLVGELMVPAQILSGKGARPAMLFSIAWLGDHWWRSCDSHLRVEHRWT